MSSTERSTFIIFQLSFPKPHGFSWEQPSLERLNCSSGVPASPCRAPGPSGQDFRMGLGSLWALAPPHVLRDSSCPLPALQPGLHCAPAEIQTGFCLNPTAWSTGKQQLLCKGVTARGETRIS